MAMALLLLLLLLLLGAATAGAKIPMPFEYKGFDAFPASFFGADIWGVENDTEMALVAKHQISGWGWQQGCMQQCCSGACNCESSNPQGCPTKPPEGYSPATGHADEEGALYNQSRAFKRYLDAHPAPASQTQGIFVYRQLSTPCWWWTKIYEAYTDPSKRGFFFTSESSGEYCWSSGPIWDFRNASARQYYLDEVIGEITAEADSGLSLVFFDGGLGMLAENPHPSPSGLVGGSGNCSISYNASEGTGGKDLNFTDADRMDSIRASLGLLVEVAEKLNAASLIPIYSMAVPFDPIVAAHRGYPGLISEGQTFTEAEVVEKLKNVTWMRYYEWFQSNGWSESIGMSIENVINETANHDLPIMAHAYGKPENCSDPNDVGIGSAIAAFLIAMGPYSYFQTSSSVVGGDPWTDSGWCWHPLYEKLKCGKPKAMAAQNSTGWWVRSFDHCEVSLNQKSNAYTIMQQGELVAWNH